MIYELHDRPDDLPIRYETLAEARHRAGCRSDRFGIAVLIYEMDPFTGERLLEEIGWNGPPVRHMRGPDRRLRHPSGPRRRCCRSAGSHGVGSSLIFSPAA